MVSGKVIGVSSLSFSKAFFKYSSDNSIISLAPEKAKEKLFKLRI